MQPSSVKPSSASPFDASVGTGAAPAPEGTAGVGWVRRASTSVALLAIAVWLGGLLALGAVAAPVVFSVVPMPASADAMTIVFRRFDLVTLACALVVLVAEAVGLLGSPRSASPAIDRWRVLATLVACSLATYEATAISPRIAALHHAGVVRGAGPEGMLLSRLHDVAEWCGKCELLLLVAIVVLHVAALSPARGKAANRG